jgi:hypothetical protein
LPLTDAELNRLVRIMERTASSFDGEKLAALHLAQELLTKHGLRWNDVLRSETPPAPPPPAPPPLRGWRESAQELIAQHGSMLTPWEQDFVPDLILNRTNLTPKQEAVLRALCSKWGVAQWPATP